MDVTIQPISHPPNSPPIKSISLQFRREKDVVGTTSKALQKSRQMTSVALPLSTDIVAVIEGHSVGQAGLALGEAMLAVSNHLPVFHVPYIVPDGAKILLRILSCPHYPEAKPLSFFCPYGAVHWGAADSGTSRTREEFWGLYHQKTSAGGL